MNTITIPNGVEPDIQKIAEHYGKTFEQAVHLALRYGVREVLKNASPIQSSPRIGRPPAAKRKDAAEPVRRQTSFSHTVTCDKCKKQFDVDDIDYTRFRLSTMRGIKPQCNGCGGVGGLPPI